MAEHPGIVFKDGPTGRRAALALGPDVWEVAKAVRGLDVRRKRAIIAAAGMLNLPVERVRLALRYYGAYPDEIDAEMAMADEESRAAEEAWRAEQRLLA